LAPPSTSTFAGIRCLPPLRSRTFVTSAYFAATETT
jgi:hypothetical protein